MIFTALINVMPLKELLDPQGKAVEGGLKNLGFPTIRQVRIGRHITLQVEAEDKESARQIVEEACKKLLANMVMEQYEVEIREA